MVTKTSTSLGDLELENGDFAWLRFQVRNRKRRQFSRVHIQFSRQRHVSQKQDRLEDKRLAQARRRYRSREKGNIDYKASRLVIFAHEVVANQGAETAVAGII